LIKFHHISTLLISRLVIDVPMPYYFIFTPPCRLSCCNHTRNTSSHSVTVYPEGNDSFLKIGGMHLTTRIICGCVKTTERATDKIGACGLPFLASMTTVMIVPLTRGWLRTCSLVSVEPQES
jgi:hypothetical protein